MGVYSKLPVLAYGARMTAVYVVRTKPVTAPEHTHTHTFNGPLSGTTWVNQYQKGITSLDFIEARDSEWKWHHLGHMQVCTSLQTDNHASTPQLTFLQARCPSCRPTNSVKALKAMFCSCSLAVLDPRVGHTMDVLSPFIHVLCHSD